MCISYWHVHNLMAQQYTNVDMERLPFVDDLRRERVMGLITPLVYWWVEPIFWWLKCLFWWVASPVNEYSYGTSSFIFRSKAYSWAIFHCYASLSPEDDLPLTRKSSESLPGGQSCGGWDGFRHQGGWDLRTARAQRRREDDMHQLCLAQEFELKFYLITE